MEQSDYDYDLNHSQRTVEHDGRPDYATADKLSLVDYIIQQNDLECQNKGDYDEIGVLKIRPGLSKVENTIEYMAERIYKLNADLYSKDGRTLWKGSTPIKKREVLNILELADTYASINATSALMIYRKLLRIVPEKNHARVKISSTLSWDAENLNMVRHRKKQFDKRPFSRQVKGTIG